MRDIKFRAWDSRNESMWSPEYFKLRQDDDGYYIVDAGGQGAIRGVVLMQYTGLKDKNSVEIFEGDIVDSEWGKGQVEFGDNGVSSYGGTTWFAPGFFVKYSNNFDRGLSTDEVKVIGNIYENKELLK